MPCSPTPRTPRTLPAVRLATTAFVAAAVALSSACGGGDQVVCTPDNEGFGGAPVLQRKTLLDTVRSTGECKPRLVAYRSEEELRKIYEELELGDPPPVDFARERVVLREGFREKFLRWAVAQGDLVTLGAQGCTNDTSETCWFEIFTVSSSTVVRAQEHLCSDIRCTGVATDPGGGD